MKSIENKTSSRIYANHRGWAFSKIDFLDIGNDVDIRKALSELASKGTIRRVLRGLYDYPRISKLLGTEMGPDIDQVASALARKSGWRIQPSENTALNHLGLSTQVPAQSIYLSDGPSKTYEIGKQQLTFKKRSLKESVFKHKESELVVQALKALGQERIDDALLSQLADKWSPGTWKKILRDTKTAPAWVSDLILQITKRTEA
ncbi:DUF6088 family protein [Rubritalea tangerina]|uniref:DUF6088 family protein n=1 Tax=Rubritalea tangerina TaxID=430798 RepID=A0ABW4ZDS4_9BACT